MTVQYYKVIGKDNRSCNGGDFDWTPYLPKGGRPGKWTPRIENVVACQKGYHVTEYWNMWYEAGCRIFECEVDGDVVGNDVAGVVDKVICQRVRLIKELTVIFDTESNVGDYNTGNRNTGYHNAGNYNTGNRNVGYSNTSYCNTGNRNTGYHNTGDYNTGYRNTGNFNTGHRNTGDMNTGHMNTGNRNTGHMNTGDMNTGSWNSCNGSSGFFNTKRSTVDVFNKPCNIDVWEKASKPDFIVFALQGTMKESWRKAYDGASDEDKLLLVNLPNFDADVFYEISGIRVDPASGLEVPPSK